MTRITKNPETRRKEFIEAARVLFSEKGFEKTSINDITNYLDMSHGSFFYYFKSKNEVMKEVIKDNLNFWEKFTTDLIENKDLTALQKMELILSKSIKSQNEKQNLLDFYEKDGNAVMYLEQRKRSRALIIPLITKVVEQGVEEGTFKVDYPRETVEYVGYILENLGDSLSSAQNQEEYLRKIKAFEILLAKIAGIDKFNLK